MNDHDKESPNARRRRKGYEEELALCNEAVTSGEHDRITDKAWDRLCEQAVTRGQDAGHASGTEKSLRER